jgi:hypothetical protein
MEGEKEEPTPYKRPNRVGSSFLPLYSPEDGSTANFRNIVILIFNILIF